MTAILIILAFWLFSSIALTALIMRAGYVHNKRVEERRRLRREAA